MAKSKAQKKEMLAGLKDKTKKANSMVFTRFDALTVKDNDYLRAQLKKEDSEYYVAKKTILNLAFKDKNIDKLDVSNFGGKVAVIFGYNDEVAPARILNDFRKKNEEKISFLGGILENKFINEEEVIALAQLPTKTELYAKLVGSLNAPISGFVNVLAGNLRSLLYALNAIKESKS